MEALEPKVNDFNSGLTDSLLVHIANCALDLYRKSIGKPTQFHTLSEKFENEFRNVLSDSEKIEVLLYLTEKAWIYFSFHAAGSGIEHFTGYDQKSQLLAEAEECIATADYLSEFIKNREAVIPGALYLVKG